MSLLWLRGKRQQQEGQFAIGLYISPKPLYGPKFIKLLKYYLSLFCLEIRTFLRQAVSHSTTNRIENPLNIEITSTKRVQPYRRRKAAEATITSSTLQSTCVPITTVAATTAATLSTTPRFTRTRTATLPLTESSADHNEEESILDPSPSDAEGKMFLFLRFYNAGARVYGYGFKLLYVNGRKLYENLLSDLSSI